jgi:hypothetical protein
LRAVLRIRDVYPGSRILIFTHPGSRISDLGSRISDLGSRIQKQQQKRGVKKISCHIFLSSYKFHKIEHYFSFEVLRKQSGPIFKELKNFLPKKLSLSSQKYGFGIRDPEKTYSGSRPGVKKAPDPDPQHWMRG